MYVSDGTAGCIASICFAYLIGVFVWFTWDWIGSIWTILAGVAFAVILAKVAISD